MALRIDIHELPIEAVKALSRGETIEFEDAGHLVGTLQREPAMFTHSLWAALQELEPLDAEFETDINDGLTIARVQPHAWE